MDMAPILGDDEDVTSEALVKWGHKESKAYQFKKTTYSGLGVSTKPIFMLPKNVGTSYSKNRLIIRLNRVSSDMFTSWSILCRYFLAP